MNIVPFNFDIDIPSLRSAFELTHIEGKILQLLMQKEIASHEQLAEINERVRQLIYTLRIKLRIKKAGIIINSDRDIGYSISIRDKLHIKNIIDADLIEEVEIANRIAERFIS